MKKLVSTVLVALVIIASPAHAYIGPGMGGGVIAAVLGVIAAILIGLFGIIYYPIKRALKKRKPKRDATSKDEKQDEDAS